MPPTQEIESTEYRWPVDYEEYLSFNKIIIECFDKINIIMHSNEFEILAASISTHHSNDIDEHHNEEISFSNIHYGRTSIQPQ